MPNNTGAIGPWRVHENQALHCKELWIDGVRFVPFTLTGSFSDNYVVRGDGPSALQSSSLQIWDEVTITTTDATQTTIATMPVPTDTMMSLQAAVKGMRTGGSSGSVGDAASYGIHAGVINTGGTARIVGQNSTLNAEDQAAWGATFTASGGNVLLRVTGAVNNTIAWFATVSAS